MKHFLVTIAAMGVLACAAGPKIVNQDVSKQKRLEADINGSDIHVVATKMVDSLRQFRPMLDLTESGKRPIVFVNRIENRTMEHMDLASVAETIRRELLHTGKFRFVDMSVLDQLQEQLEHQAANNGLVDPSKAKQVGKMIGADFMLYGAISSIVQKTKNEKSVYYKFTINLVDVETGELFWTEEQDFSRLEKRRTFGS